MTTPLPLVVAPMAGGPSTPQLVVAAATAGAFALLAGGYRSVDQLCEDIHAVRAHTEAFGVNLFAPPAIPVSVSRYREYATTLAELGARFGVATEDIDMRDDDDGWNAKVQLLLDEPVPVVTATFGIPDADVVAALQQRGTRVGQTVTNAAEAHRALAHGVDFLVLQSAAAGGHLGTLDPTQLPTTSTLPALVAEVREITDVEVWAAGGIATATDVSAALSAGANRAVIGTAALLADEAGTNSTHRAALVDWSTRETAVTHAFSGRPARGIRNAFIDEFSDRAPLGYPAIHHLVAPIRRVAASTGDAEWTHLWAGTGFAQSKSAPIAEILRSLTPR